MRSYSGVRIAFLLRYFGWVVTEDGGEAQSIGIE